MGVVLSDLVPGPASPAAAIETVARWAWTRRASLALSRLVDWLMPDFPDRETRTRARFCIQAWLIAWPFSLLWGTLYAFTDIWGQVVLNAAVALVGPVAVFSLRRDGRLAFWSHVSLGAALFLYGLGMLTQTPIDETNMGFLVLLPLLASFIFDGRGAAGWTVATAVVSVLIVVAGNLGYTLPARDPTPLLSKTLNVVFATLMMWLFASRFHAVRRDALWRAEEASRAKNVFLATIGHEIRTPMNGVLGMTEVLLAERSEPALREQLEVIQRSGRVMVALINDLLDLTKLEDRKLSLDPQPFELDEVLRDVEHLSQGAAQARGVGLSFARGADVPPWLTGDALRLRQVLGNLVGNAVKFTEAGQVVVQVERAGPGDQPVPLRFIVTDTGIGIAPEHLPRLFSLFEQGDSSTTRRFGGTGLGLALCRQLVAVMGGRIEVESTPGRGSRFTVLLSLPLAAPRASPQGPEFLADDGAPGGRVLVVDDNAINLRVTSSLVEKAGYASATAVHGAQAVELAGAGGLVAVLMDCHMPVMDGFEATRRIRALGGLAAQVPIVALTASAAPEDVEACLRAGMNAVLAKPLSLRELRLALARATGRVAVA